MHVTSNVLHGSSQTFSLNDLKYQLQSELEQANLKIAEYKVEVIQGNKQKIEILAQVDKTREKLIERKSNVQ